ncbi:MAG: oligopeptide ABC transporter substrate-binding protein [Enterococcus sp.]
MKKKVFGLVALTSVFALAACGNGSANDSNESVDTAKFPTEVSNTDEAIDGGTLNVAVVTDSNFAGLFQWEFYQDAYDATFMAPSHEGLFNADETFKIKDGGIANLEIDQDEKTATITLRDNVKWSDGEDLTADDVIFPYEIIGDADYTGVRYDDTFTNIVGMEEFHDGDADSISGIEKVDDLTVKITYKEVSPSMLQAGGGVWSYAAPYHVLKDIPVGEMEGSDAVRKNPVTLGPYYMKTIQAGESIEYAPNEYYYGETPKLDKVVFTSVPSSNIVEGMKAKKYDLVESISTDTYTTYKDLEGYEMLGNQDLAYTYIGFKLGTWDAEAGKVQTDPDAKMADKSLRQAMGYAIDNDAVGEKFYNGLRENASTLIIPAFGELHDEEVEGYSLDLEKANKLLDDAGYADVDDDGIREDKDGEKLTINFASMAGGETAQPLADYYVQQWKKIGLDVQYTTGRLIEFNSFYDKLKNDDPEIDIYQGAWGTGSDPNPTGLYGPNAAFNYTRFESDEQNELLDEINSPEAFDADFQKEAYTNWQEYAAEEAFVIPTLYRYSVVPVSTRVTGYSIAYDSPDDNVWATVGVTSDSIE